MRGDHCKTADQILMSTITSFLYYFFAVIMSKSSERRTCIWNIYQRKFSWTHTVCFSCSPTLMGLLQKISKTEENNHMCNRDAHIWIPGPRFQSLSPLSRSVFTCKDVGVSLFLSHQGELCDWQMKAKKFLSVQVLMPKYKHFEQKLLVFFKFNSSQCLLQGKILHK